MKIWEKVKEIFWCFLGLYFVYGWYQHIQDHPNPEDGKPCGYQSHWEGHSAGYDAYGSKYDFDCVKDDE